MCPISLARRRRRRLARTFHPAHIFLQTEHERGPPLRRRCARICVIAAGPPPPLMLQGASILSGDPYPFMRLLDEAAYY
jgi:hypothetical protein